MRLVFFEGEGYYAGEDIDQQEAHEEEDAAQQIFVGRMDLWNPRKTEFFESPERDGSEEQKVDYWRDERENDLEQEDIGKGDPAQSSEFRAEERVFVLPKRLQSATGPAETLAN